jgi:hypothetical protein
MTGFLRFSDQDKVRSALEDLSYENIANFMGKRYEELSILGSRIKKRYNDR